MKLPFLAQHDEILQQIIRTQPAYHAIHSYNSDQFTPNSIFTEDMESFKEKVTASTAFHPNPEPEPDTWLSTLRCKTYGLEMEKKKALILLSRHVHQTPGTHARHKSLPNLGTKSTARPCKNILCAREKAYSAVLKIGKAGPRPILRSHSYSRPIISIEKGVRTQQGIRDSEKLCCRMNDHAMLIFTRAQCGQNRSSRVLDMQLR